MQFVQLTHAQRHAFEADGFLIVPQAIDAATVASLTRASDGRSVTPRSTSR